VSTRLLIYTGELIAAGISPRRAATASIISAISDDASVQQAVADIVDVILP
jgi:nitric oxide reductase NorQ protein